MRKWLHTQREIQSDVFERRLLMLAVLMILGACGQEPPPPPDVILITLDTVRADHLGCYGYHRNTTPRIDRWADSVTVYTRALSTAPWTVPSHASLFTGKYPFEHGAHTIDSFRGGNNVNPLDTMFVTLPELFAQEGYATGAFVVNGGYLSPRWQLDQGFETYEVAVRHTADQLNEKVFPWLEAHAQDRFFLFLNYMDAHRVYNTKPCPGLLPRPAIQDQGELLDSLAARVLPGTDPVPHELAQQVIDQYDTGIAHLDVAIGALLDYLRARGLYDNTLIILTSDHGEYFGEHHLVDHSKDVYQEAMWVPLFIKGPRQHDHREVTLLTSGTDIPGLVLAHYPPDFAARERRIFRDAPGNHLVIGENYYSRDKDLRSELWGHRFQRIRTAVYDWPLKLIRSSDEQHELYDLGVDPTESTNLFAERPDVAIDLMSRLATFEKERERSSVLVDQAPLSEEELERLRSLGYLGND